MAERYPDAGLAPPVSDHAARAKYLYWLFFGPSCIEPAIMQAFTKMQVPSTMAGWGTTEQVFDVLDAALAKGPWLLGDRFSAADLVIGSGRSSGPATRHGCAPRALALRCAHSR